MNCVYKKPRCLSFMKRFMMTLMMSVQIMKFLAFKFAVEIKFDKIANLKGILPYYGDCHVYCARMFLSLLTKKIMRKRVGMIDYVSIRV